MNKIQRKLYDYCCYNSPEQLQATLDSETSNKTIDITFDDGQLFGIAISNGMSEILSVLLNYYKKINLQCDQESYEYKLAKSTLVNILQTEVDSSCTISEEIWEILRFYDIKDPEVDELESEQDLEGFDVYNPMAAEDLPQDVTIAHSVETSEVLSPHYDSSINDQAPGQSELIGEA